MTHVTRLALLALTLTFGVVAASPSDARGPRPSFEALDANGDGQLTREELTAHRATRFTEADANSDGLLSLEELTAAGAKHAENRAARMLARLDANEDGALSVEEMQAARRGGPDRLFRHADANGDGAITREEFEAAQAARGERRKP